MKASKITIGISLLLALVYLAFAVLQLNDPDPVLWFSIYFAIGVLCVVNPFLRIKNSILWVVVIALAVYAASYFTYLLDWLDTSNKEEIFGEMVYEKPYLEGSREFIGLIIGIAGVLFLIQSNKKQA